MAKRTRKEAIRKELKKKEALASQKEAVKEEPVIAPEEELPEIETFEDIDDEIDTSQTVEYQKVEQKRKISFSERVKKLFMKENKVLHSLEQRADQILALEGQMRELKDEDFPVRTQAFKEQLENGKTLDDILVEAFALAREAARRVLGLHAFKVQLMGGIALHQGDIAEMKTGEGKTLTSIFPAYLNALTGKGVHIVTVNDYLAGRDAIENGRVFKFLGLSVGLNKRELSKADKRAQHACDITYTTNSELGFDYLRDNMVKHYEDKVLRPLNYAIVDEVDSILIDESRTPLIISGGEKNTASLYIAADQFVKRLKEETDYEIDIQTRSITLTEHGIQEAEKAFKLKNLYDIENTPLVHHINQALRANYIMTRDVEYVVSSPNGQPDQAEILIVDQFTGRLMPGRQYSDGLHQAIEAKEGVRIKQETVTLATITYQNFFRLFNKLAGMTGTAKTEEEEFRTIYNMRVIEIPTNRPVIREDAPDIVYSTKKAKFNALCDEVERRHRYGQPILIGTIAVETSELVSRMLTSRGIRHNVLNAKNHAREAEIIMKAGVRGAVTIATNMAGRGTDIKLGPGVAELGGLAVLGSERHESRRIDNQLRGRSGRQGDPGYSRFYVSFEDDLMQRFGSERVKSMAGKLEDTPIEFKSVSKAIETAQKRVEGQNFDTRKQLLQYDDVMRQQREIMYAERDTIMTEPDLSEIVKTMFQLAIEKAVTSYTKQEGKENVIDVEGVMAYVAKNFMLFATLNAKNPSLVEKDPERLKQALLAVVFDQYRSRFRQDMTLEQRTEYEKNILLSVIDYAWINHIDAMSKLRTGIYLRAYAQKDPLAEYTEEGFYMFEAMNQQIAFDVSSRIIRMGLRDLNENVEEIVGHRNLDLDFR
ncbi:MAG TPA: preprotein translocase subunit SecA [Candidatus Fimiplasma intestinipullorum]|uniref:Protein translocase subunit SecA n=1 Tax=Candidatus Fimiplasma intestinipullorum TaxID=2840825 RepID=A0A9D1L148_9FIRM|nr:preprotein translocase subunit SecA [Candidatus Fimiplasma intestinipullorum]